MEVDMKTLGLEDPFIDHWPLELGSSEEVLQMIREKGGDCGRYVFCNLVNDATLGMVATICGYFSCKEWCYAFGHGYVMGPCPYSAIDHNMKQLPSTDDWLFDLASRERLTSRRLSEKAGITIRTANVAISKAVSGGRIVAVSREETGDRFGREECGRRTLTVYGLTEV